MYNNDTPIVHTHFISVEQVIAAIHKLKPSKSDCIDGIYSENFKHGTLKFCYYYFYVIYCNVNPWCRYQIKGYRYIVSVLS